MSETPNSAIIFNSSTCTGVERSAPKIKENINRLKELDIPYYLIEDQLYDSRIDKKIDYFKSKYGFEDEKVYLMDIKKYPNNSGILNSKRRYKAFMNDICDKCGDTLMLGPNYYVFIKDGKYIKSKFSYSLTEEDLSIFKK